MELYLEHHGILGQRWGVRRFQNADGSLTAKGRVRYGYGDKSTKTKESGKIKTAIESAKYKVDKALVNAGFKKVSLALNNVGSYPLADFKEDFRTSRNIGKTVRVLGDAIVGQYQFVDYDDSGTYSEGDKWFSGKNLGRARWLPEGQRASQKQIANEAKFINPGYGSDGTTNNCVRCSIATELTQQGYSGIRAGKSRYGGNMYGISDYFEGAKTNTITNYGTDIDDYMRKNYGNNTSGVWSGTYSHGSGHAMHWSIGEDGKVQVEDGQDGSVFRSFNDAISAYGFDRSKGGVVLRLDNCKPNWEKLSDDGMYKPSFTGIDGHSTEDGKGYSYGAKQSDGTVKRFTTYSEARDDAKQEIYNAYKDWKKKTYFNY